MISITFSCYREGLGRLSSRRQWGYAVWGVKIVKSFMHMTLSLTTVGVRVYMEGHTFFIPMRLDPER